MRRLAVAGGACFALGLSLLYAGTIHPWRWLVPPSFSPVGFTLMVVGFALLIRAAVRSGAIDTPTLRRAEEAAIEPVSPKEAEAAASPAFRDFCRRNDYELAGYRLRTPEPVVIVLARERAQ